MSNDDVAIRVENLSKLYRIGSKREKYRTLRDTLTGMVSTPFQHLGSKTRDSRKAYEADNTFWALQDVSFEIKRGEVVGVIGRNGAGKSTLLKVLSRITEPTSGRTEIHGRIASLLEVGTGFHPELTGRENIYLNGAILGMKRKEINSRFDEIVAFSEVEKFIDTPVKHYSSGMYLRLAFAVAAHLEPEILLVDEVLAVGDASFQRKCLNKMQEVGQRGRTVLFVSHNMPAVTRLCQRTILLDEGRVQSDGPSHQVAATYLRTGTGVSAARTWEDVSKSPGNDIVRLRSVKMLTKEGIVQGAFDIRQPIGIEMQYDVQQSGYLLTPNYHVFNDEGVYVFVAGDQDSAWRQRSRPPGHYKSTAWIPGNLLTEGIMIVGAAISTLDPVTVHFYERDAVAFQVIDTLDGDSARGSYGGHIPGVIRPLLEWTTQFTPSDANQVVISMEKAAV